MTQNDNFYLAEAFNRLSLLNEDAFDLSADKGVVDELQSFVADDIEAPFEEEIIDVAAEDADDIQDSYVGKVILQCECCHSKVYKNPDEVILDENEELANVDEECPVCNCMEGWKVIGKIEPFEEKDEEEPKEEEEVEVDETEFSDDEIEEALKEALNEGCKKDEECEDCKEEKCEEKCDKDLDESCKNEECDDCDEAKCEEECDKDLEEKCDESLTEEVEPAIKEETSVEHDQKLEDSEQEPIKEELEEVQSEDAEKLEDPEENPVNESLNEDIDSIWDLANELSDCDEFETTWYFKTKDDMDKVLDLMREEGIEPTDYDYEKFKEYGETYQGWIAIPDELNESAKKPLKEDVRNISVDVDGENHIEIEPKEDGGVEVEVSPSEEAPEEVGDEMIAPLNDEDKMEIEGNDEVVVDDELEAPEVEDEFEIDEFDNESFDELGESFLKRVYDNVSTFNTTKVSQKEGKLVVEGLIKFNSGKEKATSFIFENYKTTKRGKTMVEGMNETFSRSSKAFLLKGTLADKKYTCESLTYNYTASQINEANESETIRVYGRAVRK